MVDREFSPADPFIKYCAWTPEEERYLTTNWDANDKGRVRLIAAKLNRSRSSVIGKAHRMALRFLIPSRGESK